MTRLTARGLGGFFLLVLATLAVSACGGTVGPGEEGYGTNRNWSGAYLRAHLNPQQGPLLGEYSSRSHTVIAQHVTWAQTAQIDFFAIPWRGTGSWENETLVDYLLPDASFSAMEWCVLYETPTVLAGSEDASSITITLATRDSLLAHLLYFKEHFFNQPNYLKVNGHPVVFFRKSRLLNSGNVRQDLLAVRDAYQTLAGDTLFWVGDEAIWGAISIPNLSRIGAFDAITGIDIAQLAAHNGYTGNTGFMNDLDVMWQSYAQAGAEVTPPVPLFPMVMPGTNDRVTSVLFHPVIGRSTTSTLTASATTLQGMWNRANDHAGSGAMVLLNSFNDWRRDTQIERTADNGDANGTVLPTSATSALRYFPYGTLFLTSNAVDKGNVTLGAIYEVGYDDRP